MLFIKLKGIYGLWIKDRFLKDKELKKKNNVDKNKIAALPKKSLESQKQGKMDDIFTCDKLKELIVGVWFAFVEQWEGGV